MDEIEKKLLTGALNGEKGDGRFLLYEIHRLLNEGLSKGLKHGLLPDEYVCYLEEMLLLILETPKDAANILNITKPKHRTKEFDLTRNGAITYMCMMAKETDPENSLNKVFFDIATKISSDYKELIYERDHGEISEKTIERIYAKTYPIIRNFKHLDSFKIVIKIIKDESSVNIPDGISISDAKDFIKLNDQINHSQTYIRLLDSIPKFDNVLNKQLTEFFENLLISKKK